MLYYRNDIIRKNYSNVFELLKFDSLLTLHLNKENKNQVYFCGKQHIISSELLTSFHDKKLLIKMDNKYHIDDNQLNCSTKVKLDIPNEESHIAIKNIFEKIKNLLESCKSNNQYSLSNAKKLHFDNNSYEIPNELYTIIHHSNIPINLLDRNNIIIDESTLISKIVSKNITDIEISDVITTQQLYCFYEIENDNKQQAGPSFSI
ncbi:hypothetical protein L3V82_03895 [Thiotrichales bacterium 19S3-7]|nr:hypothetical protein [Thiotrichales bacterium 19S3-7]MCF6801816.1 hypothetical protein [Thiotrichales bacterium 19S3-11]